MTAKDATGAKDAKESHVDQALNSSCFMNSFVDDGS